MKVPTTPILIASIVLSSPIIAAPINSGAVQNSPQPSPAVARSPAIAPAVRDGSGRRRRMRFMRRELAPPSPPAPVPSAVKGLAGLGLGFIEPIAHGTSNSIPSGILTHPSLIPEAAPNIIHSMTGVAEGVLPVSALPTSVLPTSVASAVTSAVAGPLASITAIPKSVTSTVPLPTSIPAEKLAAPGSLPSKIIAMPPPIGPSIIESAVETIPAKAGSAPATVKTLLPVSPPGLPVKPPRSLDLRDKVDSRAMLPPALSTPAVENVIEFLTEATSALPTPTALPKVLPTGATSILPTAVTSALPAAVTNALPTGVTSALPTGVTKALPTGVTKAIPTAVTSALPTALTSALPTAVTSALPIAMTSHLPIAVTSALPTGVAKALPTAATKVLPTAVTSHLPKPDSLPVSPASVTDAVHAIAPPTKHPYDASVLDTTVNIVPDAEKKPGIVYMEGLIPWPGSEDFQTTDV